MSIYATIWSLKFPKDGFNCVENEWIEVIAQSVPTHIGSPTPGEGYDLILSKLSWARDSQSQTQRQDVTNLLAADCDIGYLRRWALPLGVSAELNTLLP